MRWEGRVQKVWSFPMAWLGQTKFVKRKTHFFQFYLLGKCLKCYNIFIILYFIILDTKQSLSNHWTGDINCLTIRQLDIPCPIIRHLDINSLTIIQLDIRGPTTGQLNMHIWTSTVQPSDSCKYTVQLSSSLMYTGKHCHTLWDKKCPIIVKCQKKNCSDTLFNQQSL